MSFAELLDPTGFNNLSDIALLTQTGYFTIKAFKGDSAIVDYPNYEVQKSMASLYSRLLLENKNVDPLQSDEIFNLFAEKAPEDVFDCLNSIYQNLDYLRYPIIDEATLEATLFILLFGRSMEVSVRKHNSHGRSDLEISVGDRVWIVELKLKKDNVSEKRLLESAVEQLRNYGVQYRDTEVIRLALVFSPNSHKFVNWAASTTQQ